MSDVRRSDLTGVNEMFPLWNGLIDLNPAEVDKCGLRMDLRLADLPRPYVDVSVASNRVENVPGIAGTTIAEMPALSRIRNVSRRRWLRLGRSHLDVERYEMMCLWFQKSRRRNRESARARRKYSFGRSMWRVERDLVGLGRDKDGIWWQYMIQTGERAPRKGGHRFRADNGAQGPDLNALSNCIEGALGIAEMRFIQWRVAMTIDGLPSISFMTDLTGVRSVFGLRDVAPGERRKALLHWVTAHHRQGRSAAADLVWVRKHMRGMTSFDWAGVHCSIIPSAAELDPEWSGDVLADTEKIAHLRDLTHTEEIIEVAPW